MNLFRAREVGVGTYKQLYTCYGTQGPYVPDVRDPLLGLLSEPLVPGSSLPKTIATIVAEQFKRLRKYDPNFYEKKSAQIGIPYYGIVSSSTLSRMLVRNTALTSLKSNVFYVN